VFITTISRLDHHQAVSAYRHHPETDSEQHNLSRVGVPGRRDVSNARSTAATRSGLDMNTLTTGVELELWVLDRTGRLCDGAPISHAHDRIETEFIGPLVEVQTAPHTDMDDLQRDFQGILLTAIRAAESCDLLLAPLGTPLTASECEPNCVRGQLFQEIYGDGITPAKNCAGTHIHFEQSAVKRQLNLLTALDPALALLSTSPYYRGEGGVNSFRARAYRRQCGSEFREFCDLWPYTDSLDDWRARVEDAYGAFKRLASDRGIPEATVDRYFCPEDTVLNPVRLREAQPTVEWRAPDAALPSQVLQLAADAGDVVAETATRGRSDDPDADPGDDMPLPPMPRLRQLSQQAITSGLETRAVRTYLEGFGFDLAAYHPQSPQLYDQSTISEQRARGLRLEQARRLREDVAGLTDHLDGPAVRSAL
jgi:hypothetical protein